MDAKGPPQPPSELAPRGGSDLATSPLITHAPMAIAITVTTAGIADALLLALVGIFAAFALLTPPELVPVVTRSLALCAALLVFIRIGFSLAMWWGGRAAKSEPTALAMVGFVKAVAGGWWWTAGMAAVLLGVAAALVLSWPLAITLTLAALTVAFGIARAAFILLTARRYWRTP